MKTKKMNTSIHIDKGKIHKKFNPKDTRVNYKSPIENELDKIYYRLLLMNGC